MKYTPVLLALFLGGCVSTGNSLPGTLTSMFHPDQPETVALSAPPPEVRSPVRLADMAVRSLRDDDTRRFDVSAFGNGYRVRQDNGCVWTRQRGWFSPSDSWANCGESTNWHTASAQVRQKDPLYPLRLGAEGRYERRATSHTGRSYVRETICRVTDAEAVVRPARPDTPAWVVACNDGKRVRTTWYAPGEGPVAFTQVSASGSLEESWIRIR
ncbi:hypothetical protein [Roseospira navarrensis]|uniref:Lipoprotein n=1 Tax=Roseospira navarrensis TaxID=140058 RepID=A0A7X1ZB58_9PROT|nr:hypothetical protein [Roseospira navarrensis]MQX35309.1 hypothetical protein [Roseospira navarrensis]